MLPNGTYNTVSVKEYNKLIQRFNLDIPKIDESSDYHRAWFNLIKGTLEHIENKINESEGKND